MSSKKTASSKKSKQKATEPKPEGYTFGRPTEYRAEYCKQLIDHMAGGLSFESFGAEVRCSRSVLYNWLKTHQDFVDAKGEGEILGLSFWEKAGRAGGFGQTKLDFRFWNRFMLCRFAKYGWNPERHNVTFQDPDDGFEFSGDGDDENNV